jgi:hypothetical protein
LLTVNGTVVDCQYGALSHKTTFFFESFANANVLLVLGELMGQGDEDGIPSRNAIPLIAGAIVTAQLTMAIATWIGNQLTVRGYGRKPLFMTGLLSLPIRCALIVWWKDSGNTWLLSTQILDGLGGGFFGLLHPYLVADITFGTGRFNLVMGLTASCFGYVVSRVDSSIYISVHVLMLYFILLFFHSLGATLSNFIGQHVVERYGHITSLLGSFFLSFVPIVLFCFMPETLGLRGVKRTENKNKTEAVDTYKLVID